MENNAHGTERLLTIQNVKGLHARASAKFVETASSFEADIIVSRDGQSVNATSIMGLMMLAAARGCDIALSASGPQAVEALDALESLIDAKFGEGE
ncbi:MAG: HPr family phosphocarrier protein [Alphaproteobacteria bacterium]